MKKNTIKEEKFLGYPLFSKDKASLLKLLEKHLSAHSGLLSIFTLNPEQVVQAEEDEAFQSILLQADLRLPDGIGLVWGSRLLHRLRPDIHPEALAERISGRELIPELLEMAARHDFQVLVIGGRDYQGRSWQDWQVTQLLAGKAGLQQRKAGAEKVEKTVNADNAEKEKEKGRGEGSELGTALPLYWTSGYAEVGRPTPAERQRLRAQIQALKPELIFVAYGAPQQEKWVSEERQFLEESGVRLAMVVGGSFDVLLGKLQKPPTLLVSLGLEWLFRLLQQPWRWRRQLRLLRYLRLLSLRLLD